VFLNYVWKEIIASISKKKQSVTIIKMTTEYFIRDAIILVVVIYYFIFTIRYFIAFRKNPIFSTEAKRFHLIMIWIIPFIWIFILKALESSTPGSFEIENLKWKAINFNTNSVLIFLYCSLRLNIINSFIIVAKPSKYNNEKHIIYFFVPTDDKFRANASET
jgi:hypothetical protein